MRRSQKDLVKKIIYKDSWRKKLKEIFNYPQNKVALPLILKEEGSFTNYKKNKKILRNFKSVTLGDPFNEVYVKESKIYRGIRNSYIHEWNILLKSGLLSELDSKKLIPRMKLTDYYTKDCFIIYEVEKLTDLPQNTWSFDMIKKSALFILKLNKILNKYGYRLKDCHPSNVLFKGTFPLWVDLGSIVKNQDNSFWIDCSYEGFLEFFVVPLELLKKNELWLAKSILCNRYTGNDRTIAGQDLFDSKILKRVNRKIERIPKKKIEKYIKDICFMRETNWQEYGKKYFESYLKYKAPPEQFKRFEYISEKIKEFNDVHSMLDIAGNCGEATAHIKSKCSCIKKAIIIDYDENSINGAHKFFRNKEDVEAYLLNFMLYKDPSLKKELKSDITLSLALTHHLILSQKFPISQIFKKIREVSNKYVFIEFMPWGLWGGGVKPQIPRGYNLEWFRKNFKDYFQIIEEKDFGENRYLFVGKVRG